MFDYTKAALGKIIGDFKKIFSGIKIATQLLSIVYLLCAVITRTGIFVANLVLLTLAASYFVFFLIMETKKGQRKIKKQIKNIYGWCKRLIKLLTLSVTVYGLVVAKADFEPLSFLIVILMVFAWVLEFLFYIIIKFLEAETKLLFDGMVADVEKLPFVGGYMMKKLTGKETEEEKPMTKIYRNVLSVLFAMLLMAAMWTVSVQAEEETSPFTYEVVEGAVTITGFDKTVEGQLDIPATIDGAPVTVIGEDAFNGCTQLTKITIPDSVTAINEGAFYGCKGLSTITVPAAVATIGDDAFGACTNLTAIDVAEGNAAYCDVDGVVFSKDMTRLVRMPNKHPADTYAVPAGVTTIGDSAFSGCAGLDDITFPDSVTAIETSAFLDCTALNSIDIPNSVTSIGNFAFGGCYKLVEIYNLSSLTLTPGAIDNGGVARYALNVYTSLDEASKTWIDENGLLVCSQICDEMEILTICVTSEKRHQGYGFCWMNF